MSSETLLWNKIMTAVLKMPGVKVDRIGFLRKELRPYCNQSRLQMLGAVRPYTIVSASVIDKIAKSCINRHTALATAASAVAGLPGGLAMAATVPADLTQYYYHVFVLSQKLAYLYGFPDFCDEDGELSDVAGDLLTIFMGVMMGASVADKGITELSKSVAQSAVTRLPRVAISKAALYPIVSQIARMVGTRLSRESFTKSVGKFIPLAGGVFSGGLTLFTFRPGANRLRKRLKAQRQHFSDNETIDQLEFDDVKASFVMAERTQQHPENRIMAVLQALVNMANLNDEVSQAKYHLLEHKIASAKIDGEDKLELLGNIGTGYTYDVDYSQLSYDEDYALDAIRQMAEVMTADGAPTTAEKMYLNMTAKAMGLEREQMDAILGAKA